MVELENKPLIYDLDFITLENELLQWGEPPFRIRQMWQGIYRNLWASSDQFSTFPHSLRNRLSEEHSWCSLQPLETQVSMNGNTLKTVFCLPDKQIIEAVIMRYSRGNTLCISTQVGCAMGCVFCATGKLGLQRNLSSGEIVEQVLYFARRLSAQGERVNNIVLMGMGEPFHNYENTITAINRLNHPHGFNLGARRFTISTVGIVPGIRRFTSLFSQVNLAISLHAADDDLRTSLIPINRKYPLADLLSACHEYVEENHRRITIEWALIHGLNDTVYQAQKLAHLLRPFHHAGGSLCHVNVIPLNPIPSYQGTPSTFQKAQGFKAILEKNHIPCTVRVRRGLDIRAGCGQLASKRVS